MINETINLLGLKAKDKVSGFEGVIVTASFDLFGCVCVVLSPAVDKDGKVQEGKWFDVQRLDVQSDATRVMPVPNFSAVATKPAEYTHGAADKPAMPNR